MPYCSVSQVCKQLKHICSSCDLWKKVCEKDPLFPKSKYKIAKRFQTRISPDYWRLSYVLCYSSSHSGSICPGCLRVTIDDDDIMSLCLLWKT